MYSSIGRPSIPPGRPLKAQLLIALYSVRSERQFCERLDYDLLFRFFLDMERPLLLGLDMKPPKRILVATDLSDCSRPAVDYGELLARRFEAELLLLYVSPVPDRLVGDSHYLGNQFVDADMREGRGKIDGLVAELKAAGVQHCTGEVTFGFAAKVILERARSGHYDLLIMGTHGRSGFERLWMGSIAERVVAHAPIPVLTARPPTSLEK